VLQPVAEKNAPALSPLISLAIAPFAVFGASSGTASEELYTTAFSQLFTHFLAVPLLPNRLPLASLTLLAKSLPFASLSITHQSISTSLASTSLDLKTHVLANLLAFVPPRYAALPARALAAYLDLLAQLLADVPPNTFEPASPDAAAATSWAPDSDDEDRVVRVERVDAFATSPMVPALALDAKTIARLGTLTASTHVHALVAAAKGDARPALAAALLALGTAWPARRARVLGAVHAQAGGALVRELYRGWVRGSPLGRDGAPTPAPADEAAAWPPLLFLVELYTHALLTMHDDEFFSATGDDAARNPLTLDELTGFSRQLLRVVFPLYWAADAGRLAVHVPGAPSVTYAGTRERITACLRALHARDSRKRFTPPEHWLMTSDMDAQLFVQAALYEAEQAAGDDHDAPRAELRAGTARARETAAFGPRLAVLHHIPFAVPFEVRVAVFRGWVWQDMRVQAGGGDAADAVNPRARWQRMFRDSERGRTDVTVRRGHIAQDGFDRLGDADLKGRIKITFIDEWGNEECVVRGLVHGGG
jgi:ubiquitin-protein ligase E3 C